MCPLGLLILVLSSLFPPCAGANSDVVVAARAMIGTPYRYGGASPAGTDCSGVVVWSYHQIGIDLPHSSQALARGGQPVELDVLEPGDVITYYPGASHAALYVGDGDVVNAATYGRPVAEIGLYAAGPVHNARRY